MMNQSERIPETDSIQELAAFWDRHDVTEFETELQQVDETPFQRDESHVVVHLSPDEAAAVHALADKLGIRSGDLIHRWVSEKVSGC